MDDLSTDSDIPPPANQKPAPNETMHWVSHPDNHSLRLSRRRTTRKICLNRYVGDFATRHLIAAVVSVIDRTTP